MLPAVFSAAVPTGHAEAQARPEPPTARVYRNLHVFTRVQLSGIYMLEKNTIKVSMRLLQDVRSALFQSKQLESK